MQHRSSLSRALGVAVILLAAVAALAQLEWVGNTQLSLTGAGSLPRRAAFVDGFQTVTVRTETWPIAQGQRVFLIWTGDNWRSTRELEFAFEGNFGNNSRWRLELPPMAPGTDLQFYIRAEGSGGVTRFDNNNWSNFAYYTRFSPRYRRGAILQWFETDYRTMLRRLPEVVRAGYQAIYLPPPTKSGGGGFSVGFNPFDRFDLGDRLQMGTVRTKYGTTQELFELIRTAKRLGIEVYCDVVYNHNDNRASNAINRYPDMIPEDFHIRSSADTSNNEIDFNRESSFSFGMLNHDLVGLVDIAQEDRNNTRTGSFNLPAYAQFNQFDKPTFVRHPITPQYYPNGQTVTEDVREYLRRWGWYLTNVLGFDGYRFDAVKHAPPAFFDSIATGQPGSPSSRGDLNPFLYGLNPDLNLFAEDLTSDAFELREYAKTGMNALDFPLKFKMRQALSQNGFADLGQEFGNGYGIDPNSGMPFEMGGLAGNVSVSMVQSHDDGPPASNNLAYALIMTRPASPKVYYDGNNIQPGDWTNFPRPGRADALGFGSDVILRTLDARNRFGRGWATIRWRSGDVLVYERGVGSSGLLLTGLTDNGTSDQTVTVQTAFAPGTVLVDLGGQRPNVTVDGSSRVTITIPNNSTGGPPNNGKGYVLYAPRTPTATEDPFTLSQVNSDGSRQVLDLATYDLPAGRFATPGRFRAATVTGNRITVRLDTDATGFTAAFKLNEGRPMGGLEPQRNTPEGLTDGYVLPPKLADGRWEIANVDLSDLEDGLHVVRARVFANTGNRPGVFSDHTLFFYLQRPRAVLVDGDLTDYGQPIVTQGRNPSSNSNRLDALYVRNDGRFLYVGLAGTVNVDERFTNGVTLWLDSGLSGIDLRDLQQLNDDSGPAARLLSNANITLPSGFAPMIGLGALRQSTLGSSPEAALVGGARAPYAVGSFAGLFRINPNNLFWLEGLPSTIAWRPRANRNDPPRGLEAAIPLASLFPSGLAPGAQVNLLASLLTTGEAGTTLLSTDPNRGVLGGRPAPVAWVSNQFLPTQPNVGGDPGTSRVTVQTTVAYPIAFAQPIKSNRDVLVSTPIYDANTRTYRQFVRLVNRSAQAIPGPITARVKLPSGVTLVDTEGSSLVAPGSSFRVLRFAGLNPGEAARLAIEFRAEPGRTFQPSVELFAGLGAL
jgi:alpha-amylase